MSSLPWFVWVVLALLLFWGLFVGGLLIAGRGGDARALARFVPDCIVLFRRLLGDPRLPRRYKALSIALLGYLALPFDLVPDFIPVAGQLDDAIVVALMMRAILRGGGADLVEEHWPGPEASLAVIMRFAGPAARA
jgi:uncharacterized membrane protein YkvA (DUF1232 family)